MWFSWFLGIRSVHNRPFTSKPPEVWEGSCEMKRRCLISFCCSSPAARRQRCPGLCFSQSDFCTAECWGYFFLLEILNSAETERLFLRITRENFLLSQQGGNFKVWSYNVFGLSTSLKEGVSDSATMMQSKLSCLWIPNQSVLWCYRGANLEALGKEEKVTSLNCGVADDGPYI